MAVPELPDDAGNLEAAQAYADAGWYVLPVKRGTKHPGSVVGNGWQSRSSRDPQQIAAWFAGTDHGIALHCGRSGAVVFDVDDPDKVPEALRRHLDTAPYQSTRLDEPGRGHYVFATPPGRTLGNGTGKLGGAWGEVRGLNGVIVVEPTTHPDGGEYRWERTGPVPVLPAELADQLPEASPAEGAASDATVRAFLEQHSTGDRPELLDAVVTKLENKIAAGESRHNSTCAVLAWAMTEAAAGLYPARAAVERIWPVFSAAAMQEDPKQRTEPAARSEYRGMLAWAVGQAMATDPDETRAKVEDRAPGPAFTIDAPDTVGTDGDDEAVPTVPWPVLDDIALHGTAGTIVKNVAPYTESDPAALLVQFLTVFGAMVGRDSYIRVANDEHPPILHPVIVGRTVNGAKGTSTGVVKAVARIVDSEFFTTNIASGLSSDAGLIERVSDPVMDIGPKGQEIVVNPGVIDKRLLVIETEYGSVLARGRRDHNPLAQVIRQAWDADDLRTLNRKANSLTATRPHIVIIGHITPGEFRAGLRATDFSGGSVNRLLICLSRRSRLHTRLGNVPGLVLQDAADKFGKALRSADGGGQLGFTDQFWSHWDRVYPELVRDRPDSVAVAAAGRGVPMVLRLAMIYALFDGAAEIDVGHLDAALALWNYCEHSTRWLFSTHEQEAQREAGNALANFVLAGGREGRWRTELIRDYGKGHKKAAEINAELAPLIHDGILIEQKVDGGGARPARRYVHRREVCEVTKFAGQGTNSNFAECEVDEVSPESKLRNFAQTSRGEMPSDLQTSKLRNFAASDNGEVPHCKCGNKLLTPEALEFGECKPCRDKRVDQIFPLERHDT